MIGPFILSRVRGQSKFRRFLCFLLSDTIDNIDNDNDTLVLQDCHCNTLF